MKELTRKQRKVLEFLTSYTKKYGYPPTIREIGKHFGFFWTAARGFLKSLEKKGFIKVNPTKSRGIEIIGLKPAEAIKAPLLGKIRAGKPIVAIEEIEAHIFIDKSLFPVENAFALKVTGDSMIEAGIIEGDFVVVKPQKVIENGEIGVVLIGDEATVKRIFKEREKIILKPENKIMKAETYNPDEVTIIGKVVGVIRKI
ncbi:MAG: repressor LexA [Nitrospirae bacterium]|nr:repressor LexA [Nitrospirota bacterium]